MSELLSNSAITAILGLVSLALGIIAILQLVKTGTVDPDIVRILVVVIGLFTAHTNAVTVNLAKKVNTALKNGSAPVEGVPVKDANSTSSV